MSDSVNGIENDAIPTWLDDKFLETALRSRDGDGDLVVASSEIQRATAPGDNYLSILYRAKVQVIRKGKQEKMTIIIKTEHTGNEMKRVARRYELFELEVKMFRDVIPAMNKLLEEVDCNHVSPFAAKFIYAHFGSPSSAIVLEDLKESNFEMAERKAGLDIHHCELVIKTLAKFHAASAALYKKHPELIEPFISPPTKDMLQSEFSDFFYTFLKGLSGTLEDESDDLKKYSEKTKKLSGCGMEKWCKGRERNHNEFNVLIHGDLWVNNMMFRYAKEDRKPQDIRLLDFQLSYWSSPAVDLQYFLNSSPSSDLLDDQQKFVELYHKTLGDTLAKLGYKKLHPSLEELNKQMESRGEFAVMTVFSIRNAVLVDDEDIMDVEKIINQDQKVSFGKAYLDSLRKQLPMMEKKGWF